MKRKRGLLIALTGCMLVTGILTGCGEKVTAESLLKEVNQNYMQAESLKGDLAVDIDLDVEESGVSMNMVMGVDGTMELTNSPAAMHMDGNLNADFMGLKMNFEMYSVETDGNTNVYMKVMEQWTKTEDSSEKPKAAEFQDLFDKELTLSSKTEKIEGKEVYVLEGKLNSEGLEQQFAVLKESMGEVFPEMDFGKMDIPITLKVYKNSKLPASIDMDMNGFMSEMFKTMGVEEQGGITVKNCRATMTFQEYNAVDAIEVPKEALDAAGQSLPDLAEEAL
ncbi:MAG: hypothetical protein RR705_00080 [Lachnospiraceae bacterium]